jgi:hypothetical protein
MLPFQKVRVTVRIVAVVLLAIYAHFWTGVQLHFLFHDHDHSHHCFGDSGGALKNSWLEASHDDCDFCHQVVVSPLILSEIIELDYACIVTLDKQVQRSPSTNRFSFPVNKHHNRGPPVLDCIS